MAGTAVAVVERTLALIAATIAIAGAIVSVGIYFGSITPELNRVSNDVHRVEEQNRAQDERFARMDASREVNLQRLSRVEEAVQQFQRTADQINTKLDRALNRR